MSTKHLLSLYAAALALVSLPFTVIHLVARPDDAPISPLQHVAAAAANFFGPWGVAIARLVDFPNAGMRTFSWTWAIGLTLLGALIIAVPMIIKNRYVQYTGLVFWTAFLLVWFFKGLLQIASGLL
jgi:hypothetical protein